MADISLLFDVAGGGSLSGESGKRIQEQLQGIVSEINNKPLEVKIKADQKSLDAFQSQVANIAKQFKDGVSPFGNTASSGMAAGIAQITQRATAASGALHQMGMAIGASNISMLRNSLNSLGTEISASSIDTIVSAFTDLDFVITSITPEIQNLGKEGSRVLSLLIQGTNETGDTIQQRLRFNNKGKLLDDLSKIKIKLAEVKKEANAINSTKDTGLSDEFKKAKKAVREYYNALIQLPRLGLSDTIKFNDKTKTWSATESGYDAHVTQLNRVTTAYNNAQIASETFSTSEANGFNDYVTNQIDRYRIAVEDATRADTARSERLRSNVNITNSYSKTITQGKEALKKWSAAENSKHRNSRDAYQALEANVALAKEAKAAYDDGSITLEEYTGKINTLKTSLRDTEAIVKQNGDATRTLGERFAELGKKFASWLSVSQIIMAAYRAVRQMVSAVIELDTAMTELKKVTDESDATYNKFLENAASRAKKLGASLSDVVTASADFARLGFSIDQAEKLADAAIVYKNVGDGIEDITEASESLISTLQAFGDEVSADDVMSIVDKFNEVGNNYAISSEGIGEALLRSAAAMNAANNTLDETIALATAANTIIQNPETVGTALKTVSMYLRAAKTEAEEAGESTEGMANSVSELRGEILALTGNKVDIQIDED